MRVEGAEEERGGQDDDDEEVEPGAGLEDLSIDSWIARLNRSEV